MNQSFKGAVLQMPKESFFFYSAAPTLNFLSLSLFSTLCVVVVVSSKVTESSVLRDLPSFHFFPFYMLISSSQRHNNPLYTHANCYMLAVREPNM